MVKPAHGQPEPTQDDADSLLARREALLHELRDLDAKLSRIKGQELIAQREAQVQALRGSVSWYGDVESPIDVPWGAAQ